MAHVHIIAGSESDRGVIDRVVKVLDALGIEHRVDICSAHREPKRLENIVKSSKAEVFIGIAGLSAALPGMIAAHTIKPVIGVPVSGKINLDSILSIVQMPKGVPVGAVGLDNGENAALLAAQILALKNEELREKIGEYRGLEVV
ncbi:MAG: 5-(carboxyamino)imidazole ribonucleotide mutase [Thermoplasmata archaeon]|nr:MAG: 5-(carboxyamino)imidazole ribonucleotide mutase [Thermoplasmata archaeon]